MSARLTKHCSSLLDLILGYSRIAKRSEVVKFELEWAMAQTGGDTPDFVLFSTRCPNII